MKSIDKTLEYHELLMTYDDISKYNKHELPDGYRFEFYKTGDEFEWVNIHMQTGEFTDYEYAFEIFHQFYDGFMDELNKRCFFIVNKEGKKIGTATISKLNEEEYGYNAVVDWVAISKRFQGNGLARPLISKILQLANELGYTKILLHTQTYTWLAAKLYLDEGFEPFKVEESYKGWQILKKLTNHSKLKNIRDIEINKIYSKTAVSIYNRLQEMYQDNFEYSIWDKNGQNYVEVNYKTILYKFKYEIIDNSVVLNKVAKNNKYCKVMFGQTSGANNRLEYKIGEVNIAEYWNLNEMEPQKMGGFNFSTENKILRWLVRGDVIYDVVIPKDAEVIDCTSISAPHGVFRSNKIIICNPRQVTDDMAMELYRKSELPEKSYFKAMAGCAVRGYLSTAIKILEDKVNSDNVEIAISEFEDFIKPKEQEKFSIDSIKSEFIRVLYEKLLKYKN